MKFFRAQKRIVAFMFACTASVAVHAQLVDESGKLLPFMPPDGRIVITERSDFSRYENDRYVGHSYREARLELDRSVVGDTVRYDGDVLVLGGTIHDMRQYARLVEDSQRLAFTVSVSGKVVFEHDPGYPILRGVPVAPPQAVAIGDSWMAEAVVVLKPEVDAAPSRVPVLVEYQYKGESSWAGQPALAISARYAIRYRGSDPKGDPNLLSATGSRQADILIDPYSGATLFIRESVDELYGFAGGANVRLKGFILHFHKGSLPQDRLAVATMLGGSVHAADAVPATGAVAGASSGSGAPTTATGVPPGVAGPPTGTPSAPSSIAGAPSGIASTPPEISGAGPVVSSSGQAAYQLAQSGRGIVLLLYDLRFVADSPELLPGETERLDIIASALRALGERSFLVEGHAADVGNPVGQYTLSEQRAKRIVDELVARGIPASRFRYRGLGADNPIAPNDSEANRARNRRVEITVLD